MNNSAKRKLSLSTASTGPVSKPLHPEFALQTPVEFIHRLNKYELTQIQETLQHGSDYGIWKTPLEWNPIAQESLREIDLAGRIIHFLSAGHKEMILKMRLNQLLQNGSEKITVNEIDDEHLTTKILDHAVLCFTRYLIICRVGAVGMKKTSGRPLSPSHVAGIARNYFCAILANSVQVQLDLVFHARCRTTIHAITNSHEPGCLKWINDSPPEEAPPYVTNNWRIEFNRLKNMVDRGLWIDAPAQSARVNRVTSVAGPKPTAAPEVVNDPHRPLPDDYVSEMGKKSLWLIENIGPNLMELIPQLVETQERCLERESLYKGLNYAHAKVIEGFKWLDATGDEIKRMPFYFLPNLPVSSGSDYTARDLPDIDDLDDRDYETEKDTESDPDEAGTSETWTWPPEKFSHVTKLMSAVQSAHLFVVGLSMGGRASEVLTMDRTCLVYNNDGTYNVRGRTFKLVLRNSGEAREWVLPEVAALAVEQQVRLVALSEQLAWTNTTESTFTPVEGTHLWGTFRSTTRERGMRLRTINYPLRRYAADLGMSIRPGGQQLRSHRLRKTLARLVALALTEAPKILQDVFGHKTVEMTLYYILCDKQLHAEIDTISRELRIMRSTEVIERMIESEVFSDPSYSDAKLNDSGTIGSESDALAGYGGLAAASIFSTVRREVSSHVRQGKDWGGENTFELAELLTVSGTSWDLVRPGVICTKLVGQAGPCNKKKGRPEPAMCQSVCDYRLEEAWMHEDVNGAIKEAVDYYIECTQNNDDLMAEFWSKQIKSLVPRYHSLKKKWSENPIVKSLIFFS